MMRPRNTYPSFWYVYSIHVSCCGLCGFPHLHADPSITAWKQFAKAL